jgi:PHS family inorganic phosphate transporter-like MFS transporter
MTLFALSQLVINLGPNCTTFLLPSEVFPTRVRGTAHGLSAAAGKCGAVLTAFAFGTVTKAIGLPGVLGLFSGIMGLATALTLLIPETRGKSLADIEDGLYQKSSIFNWKRSARVSPPTTPIEELSQDESVRKLPDSK